MSLKPTPIDPVPEETARRRHFPIYDRRYLLPLHQFSLVDHRGRIPHFPILGQKRESSDGSHMCHFDRYVGRNFDR